MEEDGLHHWEMEGGDDDDDSTMNRDNILGGLRLPSMLCMYKSTEILSRTILRANLIRATAQ